MLVELVGRKMGITRRVRMRAIFVIGRGAEGRTVHIVRRTERTATSRRELRLRQVVVGAGGCAGA